MASAFSGVSEGTKQWVVYIGLAVAALGPLLMMLPSLVAGIGLAAGAVGKLVSSLSVLSLAASPGGISALASSAAAAVGPIGWVVAGVAAVAAGLYLLDKAVYKNIASGEELARTLDAVTKDTGGKLAEWANAALGGHLVVKEGELVWEPKFTLNAPNVGALTKWVRTAGAEQRLAIAQEALKVKDEYTRSAAQLALDSARAAEANVARLQSARVGKGGSGQVSAFAQAQIAQYQAIATAQRAEYDKLIAADGDLLAKQNALADKFKPILIKAKITDLQSGLKKSEAALRKLTGKPQTVGVMLKEQALANKIARIKRGITDLTKGNYVILIEAKIEKTEDRLKLMKQALEKLGVAKTKPEVEMRDKLTAAIAKTEKRLKAMNDRKTEAEVKLKDSATTPATNLRNFLVTTFSKPIVQLVTVKKDPAGDTGLHSGGIASGPASGYPMTLHGREAVLPLDHPGLIPGILASAGLSRMLGSSMSPAMSPAPAMAAAGTTNVYDMRGSVFADDFDTVIAAANKRGTAKVTRRNMRTKGIGR
jgi:Holliday junction resolvase